MSRDHRLPSNHEASESNLPRLLKDCRWRYLRCGDDYGIFQRWKKTTTPMLLNADTGELIPFSSDTAPLDREVDASSSTHAAWEYAATLSRNSAHS